MTMVAINFLNTVLVKLHCFVNSNDAKGWKNILGGFCQSHVFARENVRIIWLQALYLFSFFLHLHWKKYHAYLR